MQTANRQFELVKNEGRKNELVLLASGNRYLLSLLKEECKRHTNKKERFVVRPQLVHLKCRKKNREGSSFAKKNT
ncbi:MAG: hypothetical protein IAE90_07200 [Ignavibacteria bacterium]|nr:hypothetical protein [Ignavibacteria bacterium]